MSIPTISLDPTADLRAVPSEDVQLWTLLHPFHFFIGGTLFCIPENFVTDLASVPRALQSYLANDSPVILRPALVHDWLYQSQGKVPDVTGKEHAFTRAEADNVLFAAMQWCRASLDQRWLAWIAVRIGGGSIWASHTQRTEDIQFALASLQ